MDTSASLKTFLVTVQYKEGAQTYTVTGKDLGAASRAVAERVPGGSESIRGIQVVEPQGGTAPLSTEAAQNLWQAVGVLVVAMIALALVEQRLRNWLLH